MPDFGDGSARDDWGAVDPNAPSVANGQISPAQWAEYQAKRKRDFILGMLGVLGGSVGLGAIGQGIGGAGGGAAASSGLGPQAAGAAYPGAGLFGAPATAGGSAAGVGAGVGAAGAGAGAAGSVAGGAGSGAGSAAGGILGGLSARDLAGLGLGIAGTVGSAMSGNNSNMTPTSQTTDPAMAELLNMMSGRLKKSEPLFDSVQSMANGLLPTQYQKGGGGMR